MPSRKSVMQSWRAIRRAVDHHGAAPLATVRRFWRLYRRDFAPREIELYDLLDPALSEEQLAHLLPLEGLIRLDAAHIYRSYLCLTADKAIFYSLCRTARIPTPELYAVFDQPRGWTCGGEAPASREDWVRVFESLPGRFVVKPALGLLGEGFGAFRRDGQRFVDQDGRALSASELFDHVCALRPHNRFVDYSHHALRLPRPSNKAIVQERLDAHPVLAELTGTGALSTSRVMTRVDPNGNPSVLATAIRLNAGRSLVDNFAKGKHGNLWASVDTASGRIVAVYGLSDDGRRLESRERHPLTGNPLVGFRVPEWDAVIELAMRLASAFRPQSLVSWDIAICERGVFAVEGNVGGEMIPTPLSCRVDSLLQGG